MKVGGRIVAWVAPMLLICSATQTMAQEDEAFAGEDLFSETAISRQVARPVVMGYIMPFNLQANSSYSYDIEQSVSRSFWGVAAGLSVAKETNFSYSWGWRLMAFFQPHSETRISGMSRNVFPVGQLPQQVLTQQTTTLEYNQFGVHFDVVGDMEAGSLFLLFGADLAMSLSYERTDEEHPVDPQEAEEYPGLSYTRPAKSVDRSWISYLGGEVGLGYNLAIPSGILTPTASFVLAWIPSPIEEPQYESVQSIYSDEVLVGFKFTLAYTIDL